MKNIVKIFFRYRLRFVFTYISCISLWSFNFMFRILWTNFNSSVSKLCHRVINLSVIEDVFIICSENLNGFLLLFINNRWLFVTFGWCQCMCVLWKIDDNYTPRLLVFCSTDSLETITLCGLMKRKRRISLSIGLIALFFHRSKTFTFQQSSFKHMEARTIG